jgi:hypothetical protein
MDAILDLSIPTNAQEPTWPKSEFIVGNPPFLGGQRVRDELSDEYVAHLFPMWADRVANGADLCCYWLEKARRQIELGKCKRAGLLATQAIRGGKNRKTLERIKDTGNIFFAISDRNWILDGAVVHVSMIGFDKGAETVRSLDGITVTEINPDLTASVQTHAAKKISTRRGIAFQGPVKVGAFDISLTQAAKFLRLPNPTRRPNSDIICEWIRGEGINQRDDLTFIIDFGEMEYEEACLYEAPFEYVKTSVKPSRDKSSDKSRRKFWWRLGRSGGEFRRAVAPLERYICTCQTAKHRLFVWAPQGTLPAQTVIAFALSDDFDFGVLHSRVHRVWAIRTGTQLRELDSGARYTPTTCFETFPFPEPTDAQREAIAAAAKGLDTLRNNWLNPPEWTRTEVLEFLGSVGGPWKRYIDPATVPNNPRQSRGLPGAMVRDATPTTTSAPGSAGGSSTIATVRYPRIVPKDEECANHLKKRTLTNLYNERPTWLDLAHKKLDTAVFAAYGWDPAISDDDLLAALLALNLERAAAD